MTVLERSPRSSNGRLQDGAGTRRSAMPTDGEDGQVSSRGSLAVHGEAYPNEARPDGPDDGEAARSIRPWVVEVSSVVDSCSDDSRPDHVHAEERPHEHPKRALRQGVEDGKKLWLNVDSGGLGGQ
jgi:hypothetical protein